MYYNNDSGSRILEQSHLFFFLGQSLPSSYHSHVARTTHHPLALDRSGVPNARQRAPPLAVKEAKDTVLPTPRLLLVRSKQPTGRLRLVRRWVYSYKVGREAGLLTHLTGRPAR